MRRLFFILKFGFISIIVIMGQNNLVVNGDFEKLEISPKWGLKVKDWLFVETEVGTCDKYKKYGLIKMDFYTERPAYHLYRDGVQITGYVPTVYTSTFYELEFVQEKVKEYIDSERNGRGIALIYVGYAGIYGELSSVIGGSLAEPLKRGKLYEVKFDYCVMDFWSTHYTTYGLGVKFSYDSLITYLFRGVPVSDWTVVPMEHDVGLGYEKIRGRYKAGWQRFCGIYRAKGGERYISIGLFAGDTTPIARYQNKIKRIKESEDKSILFLHFPYWIKHPGIKVFDFMIRRGYIKKSKNFDRRLKKIDYTCDKGVIIAVDNVEVYEIDRRQK